jgi:TfoX/Sxy family transcriptional regulator of competence genes
MSARRQSDLAKDFAARIDGIGPILVRPYFAGASLRAAGAQFAFVMKGVLYLKVDDGSRATFEARGSAPFTYSGARGPVTVAAYYEAPDDILDDAEALSAWAADALRAARSKPQHRQDRS